MSTTTLPSFGWVYQSFLHIWFNIQAIWIYSITKEFSVKTTSKDIAEKSKTTCFHKWAFWVYFQQSQLTLLWKQRIWQKCYLSLLGCAVETKRAMTSKLKRNPKGSLKVFSNWTGTIPRIHSIKQVHLDDFWRSLSDFG